MMTSIGGYFGLADYESGLFPHHKGILLNTGRNALEYILRSIGNVKGIYLPYYTCEVVLEPLRKLDIPYTFYHIDSKFEIADEIGLKEDEYIVANNYYGIKDDYIHSLALKYNNCLIVDCAQALFAKPVPGIRCFYSTRKYVGVADGGVAYLGNNQDARVSISEVECTSDHDSHLLKRKNFGAEAGFSDYQDNEKKLDNQPIRLMSESTRDILDHIDYEKVVAKRRANFSYLHKALAAQNLLHLPDLDTFACPMAYPFMTETNRNLRKELIDNKIFVARYWPNVELLNSFETEYNMANGVIPLPCDQRYGEREMDRILEIINRK